MKIYYSGEREREVVQRQQRQRQLILEKRSAAHALVLSVEGRSSGGVGLTDWLGWLLYSVAQRGRPSTNPGFRGRAAAHWPIRVHTWHTLTLQGSAKTTLSAKHMVTCHISSMPRYLGTLSSFQPPPTTTRPDIPRRKMEKHHDDYVFESSVLNFSRLL